MNRSKFHVFAIFLLVFAAGCSSNVAPPANVTYPQVNYVKGSAYIYYAQDLNATTGLPIAGSGDTIKSVVLATGISYQPDIVRNVGISGVTEIQNTHTNPGTSAPIDTTYIAQSNGYYWHYNYGLESLNSNPSVLAVVGKPIKAGWILQSKFSSAMGDKWVAADTVIITKYANGNLIDTATEGTDSTITTDTINVSLGPVLISIPTKHSVHSVTITVAGAPLGGGTEWSLILSIHLHLITKRLLVAELS